MNRGLFGKRRVYLDAAASLPVSPAARRTCSRALRSYGNPSSPHEEGRTAQGILEEARAVIARNLEAKADDIIFTSGATEANNIAIQGMLLSRRFIEKGSGKAHALYLPSAHASVVETMHALTAWGVEAEPLPVRDGRVDTEKLASMLRPETILVSMDVVCGETGTLWNTREVIKTLDASRAPGEARVFLHADASQAPLVESVERTKIAADLIILDAQKVGGVRGIGVLCASRTIPLSPIIFGGGQERGMRSGTPFPALAAAFAAALTDAARGRAAFVARALAMRSILVDGLEKDIPDLLINGGREGAPHILSLSFPNRDTDYLVALLDEAGYAVSTRSACETDAGESRAVRALYGDSARSAATLRISFCPDTNGRDVLRFRRSLVEMVRFLDRGPS